MKATSYPSISPNIQNNSSFADLSLVTCTLGRILYWFLHSRFSTSFLSSRLVSAITSSLSYMAMDCHCLEFSQFSWFCPWKGCQVVFSLLSAWFCCITLKPRTELHGLPGCHKCDFVIVIKVCDRNCHLWLGDEESC